KTRARAAWSGSGDVGEETIWFDIASDHGQTEFLGYKLETSEAQILAMVKNGKPCKSAQKGDAIDIVVNQTPFYAESGGQVGDTGQIKTENGSAEITDTVKRAGLIIHRAKMKTGEFATHDSATLTVDNARRTAIRANHSATHLLHEALRQSLGDHVAQRGSLNDATRLRFDFSHAQALDAEQMTRVESEVNDYIRQNTPVDTRIMAVDDARALGAQALFGEKYGEEVRVVAMGRQDNSGKGMDKKTYSLELCGGTHVKRTGDIGLFILTGQSASSAGVRRIEGLTGRAALDYIRAQKDDFTAQISAMNEDKKQSHKKIKDLETKVAMAGAGGEGAKPAETEKINGVNLLAQTLKGVSGKDLRGLIDEHKTRMGSGVILLIADVEGKAAIAVGITDDMKNKISAVDIIKIVSETLGGKGGGGREDFAQSGGGDPSKAEKAFDAVRDYLKNKPPQ
ncbi:MAG: alanine--tRNA ligase, partial [Proteobacteria bacterium]|nr:alanine--tRNA ligase [Pseudomonadota bacterium]